MRTTALIPGLIATCCVVASLAPAQFIENRGQLGPDARFLVRDGRMAVFLADGRFVVQLRDPLVDGRAARTANVFFEIEGAGAECRPVGTDPLDARVHYLIGDDPARWTPDVPTWSRVRMPGPRPGIALDFRLRQAQVEYDVLFSEGAVPSDLVVRVRGADSMGVDPTGALVVATAVGTIRHELPIAYRVLADGGREPVPCSFRILDSDRYGFEVPACAGGTSLVIDPIITYGAYLSGSSVDEAEDVVTDAAGAVYVGGYTSSTTFPTTPGVVDSAMTGSSDGFVSKFGASGAGLVYSTFIGGSGSDFVHALAVNSLGQVTIAGKAGAGFPTTAGAYDTTHNGWRDAYAARLNATGNGLVFSTFVGGDTEDVANAVAVDAAGNVYLTGQSKATNFPSTAGAYDTTTNGWWDVFVAKVSSNGQSLLFSTHFGGIGTDWGHDIALASDGTIVVVGSTDSGNFPTTASAYDPSPNGGLDAFVARFSATGSALLASTVLGSTGLDHGMALALDPSDAPCIAGVALPGFPTTAGAYDTLNDNGDAFVAKLSVNLDALAFSTFIGGSSTEQANAIAIDAAGCLYVAGFTNSANFPVTPGATMATYGAGGAPGDGFLAKLGADGSRLDYATYVGGAGHEQVFGIRLGGPGTVFVTGVSSSANLPVSPGSLATATGGDEGFMLRFDIPLAARVALGPGWSTGATTPVLGLSADPVIGHLATLVLTGAAPSRPATIYASAPAPATLYAGIVPIYVSALSVVPLAATTTSSQGLASVVIPVPSDAAIAGLTVNLQAVVMSGTGPFGIEVSGGLAVTAGY